MLTAARSRHAVSSPSPPRVQEEAKKDNLTEVTEEDRRAKEDPREDARRARRLKVAKELLAKEEAEAQGLDYARIKAMDKNVEQVDWEVKTKEKRQRNATIGFASTARVRTHATRARTHARTHARPKKRPAHLLLPGNRSNPRAAQASRTRRRKSTSA